MVVNLIGEVRAALRRQDAGGVLPRTWPGEIAGSPRPAHRGRGARPVPGAGRRVPRPGRRRCEPSTGTSRRCSAEAADGTPDDPTWPARLLAVLELLREHILKEQDGVFPAALTVLRHGGTGSGSTRCADTRLGPRLPAPAPLPPPRSPSPPRRMITATGADGHPPPGGISVSRNDRPEHRTGPGRAPTEALVAHPALLHPGGGVRRTCGRLHHMGGRQADAFYRDRW